MSFTCLTSWLWLSGLFVINPSSGVLGILVAVSVRVLVSYSKAWLCYSFGDEGTKTRTFSVMKHFLVESDLECTEEVVCSGLCEAERCEKGVISFLKNRSLTKHVLPQGPVGIQLKSYQRKDTCDTLA